MNARKLVGRNDLMLSKPLGEQRWTATHTIDTGDRIVRAVFLTECEVDDPSRFGYFGGQWYRLEEAEFEQPKRRTFYDELGSYTLTECAENDPDKIFYLSGSYWKRG